MTFIPLTDPARITTLIRGLDAAGAPWHGPLFRAALAGELQVLLVQPGARVSRVLLNGAGRPVPLVVLLAGDGGGPADPDAFPQARRLMRWARFILLHGAGGEVWHYRLAVEAAQAHRRLLIAETTSAALPAWIALKRAVAPGTRGLVVAVPEGEPPHPSMPARPGAVVR